MSHVLPKIDFYSLKVSHNINVSSFAKEVERAYRFKFESTISDLKKMIIRRIEQEKKRQSIKYEMIICPN